MSLRNGQTHKPRLERGEEGRETSSTIGEVVFQTVSDTSHSLHLKIINTLEVLHQEDTDRLTRMNHPQKKSEKLTKNYLAKELESDSLFGISTLGGNKTFYKL